MKVSAQGVAMLISGAADKIPRRVLVKAAIISAERVRAVLVKKTPADQGIMRNAWQVRVSGLDSTEPVRVENLAPYAGIVERGARPHPVSAEGVQAIREWVIRQGIATYELGPGKGKQGPARQVSVNSVRRYNKRDEAARAVESIVWGIVNKLKTKGQKGNFAVERLVPYAAFWASQEIPRLLKAELEDAKDTKP